MWKEYNSHRISLVHKHGCRFIVLYTNMAAVTSCKNDLFSAYSINREVKHHVYVKRQMWICTTWSSFRPLCHLLFIISTHKLVVSCNFLSIRIFLAVFICSFSILRNSQLDVCRKREAYTLFYYTLYSLSVFSLAKSLQLILEISATYR